MKSLLQALLRPSLARLSFTAAVVLLLLLAAESAHAQPIIGNAFTMVGRFEDEIVQRVTQVVNGPDMDYVTSRFFIVMALALFMMKAMGWGLRGFHIADMWETIMQIIVCGFLLGAMTTILPAFFNASLFIGQSMLTALAGINNNSNQSAGMLSTWVNMFITYGRGIVPDCELGWNPLNVLDCIQGMIVAMLAALVMAVVLTILCIVIMIVDIWGFWLFAIALATGKILVPFMLYKRLEFLWMGWQRFFFGALVYVILARVNLALVAIAIFSFLGTSVQAVSNGSGSVPTSTPVGEWADVIGVLLFTGIGIFTLLSTGRFAQSIISGAGGGGVNFGKMASKSVGAITSSIDIAKTAYDGWNKPVKVGDGAAADGKKKDWRDASKKKGKSGSTGSGASGSGASGSGSSGSGRTGSGREVGGRGPLALPAGSSKPSTVYTSDQYKKAGFGGMMMALHKRAERKHSSYRAGSNIGKSARMGAEDMMPLGGGGMMFGAALGAAKAGLRQVGSHVPFVRTTNYDPYEHARAQQRADDAYEKRIEDTARKLKKGGMDDDDLARSAAEDLFKARQAEPYKRLTVKYDKGRNTYTIETDD